MKNERFDLASYEEILKAARLAGYRFVPFGHGQLSSEKLIFLRHDVDYSMTAAAELAAVNARQSVSGTFFVLLRSQIYNLLSPWSLDCLRAILERGQRVALHFTAAHSGIATLAQLAHAITSDFRILQAQCPQADHVFSWHNPSAAILELARDWHPTDLLNAYHRTFTSTISYYSDSNLRNSCEDFHRAIAADLPRMQLLFHPIIWVAGGKSMIEVLGNAWPLVIQDREQEFRTNRVYGEYFPEGMPESVLLEFQSQFNKAVHARSPCAG